SPGNLYSPKALPMNIPSLDHLFRLCVEMAPPQAHTIIPSPHGTSSTRIIMPIAGGTISGPTINGTIVPNSGADWAMHLSGTDFTKLDARYTLQTSDNHHILVHSFGIFSHGPRTPASSDPSTPPPETVTQDHVEWFTHIELEAPGDSPYNYLNGVLAVGVLSQNGGRLYIDVYRLTNFPGVDARDFRVE
ncbi:hypothetical protein BDV97DRAFT_282106, partial [Delphinella strobiligena]